MAQEALPIRFAEVLNLTALGVKPEFIKFKNVTMESDKFISVLEEGSGSVAIIDTVTKKVTKLPAKVDSAIMNPISHVVGFRAANNLQIYNLEMQTRMKVASLPDNVVFWKWMNQNTIAIVTEKSVLHWSMNGDAAPEKIFDRAQYDGSVQILNYKASSDEKWLILGGLAARPTGVNVVPSGVAGVLQLYSVDRKVSQPTLDAHAGTFANVKLDGRDSPSILFCFVTNSPQGPKLSIIEVGSPKEQVFKAMTDVKFQVEQDFALSMHSDDKRGTLFLLTKAGFLYLYEIQSTKCIFAKRISQSTMFVSVSHVESGGVVSLDQTGRLILVALDEANLVQYIMDSLKDTELGVRMAARYNLPGAGDIFRVQFDKLIAAGQVAAAARIAVEAPQEILRTPETLNAFKRLPAVQGQPAPILQYFSLLLQRGKLNTIESIELTRPVLASGAPAGKEHLRGWIADGKLEFSEELGDLLRQFDIKLACSVYLRASCSEKAIMCFLQLGEFDKIVAYAKSVNFLPDYSLLLQQLHRVNRDHALSFAQKLHTNDTGPLLPVKDIVDIFMASQDAKSTTAFLLDYLQSRGDRPEDGELQTKLLEINLMYSPQVADAIFESSHYNLSHFDHQHIAQLCERANLFSRALEYYVDMTDIKRVLLMGLNSGLVKPEFIVSYFGRHTPENCVEILREILKFNAVQHIRLVVEVAKTYSKELSPASLIKMFEDFDAQQGLFFYLGTLVNFSEDADVVFKYIESGVKLNQMKEVERICRDHTFYDAKQVKDFLIAKELPDPRPLIQVCDRHDFVDELTRYLYSKNMFPFLEAYVTKMNAGATPKVIGSLIDLSCDDNKIRDLLNNLRPPACPIEQLCEEVGKRTRLRLLLPWLEARRNEGNVEPTLHNALAKIYVETNNNPSHFLLNNEFYDSKVVGSFCESRDPHLAFIAYRRANGPCDVELLEVSNKHGFYKDQARYLVVRQDPTLWEMALANNVHRRAVIDQVVATALPESRIPEEVSTTVKAFMAADLPKELIELLERIVLHGPSDSEFHTNRNLQNLLILTAIKADPSRVSDYLNRLDNYDGPDIARIAISDQYKLYEAAFFIYKKFTLGEDAIRVLLDNIDSVERAIEFAAYWDKGPVWSILARALLQHGRTTEAIDAFMKASDPSAYADVIAAASKEQLWPVLIVYLKMSRSKLRESALDNELVYAMAHSEDLTPLEEFLSTPHIAKLESIGDRLFDEGLYLPALTIYNHLNIYAKLALCYVHLHQFQAAVDAARKANSIPTWKAICYACVDALEFRLAQACGVHIIVFMDHLSDLIHHYEVGCHFEQAIALLEQGINLDRAHQGIFTTLGLLYAKYKSEKLMEHVKLFWSRLNIPTLLGGCLTNRHYVEAVFLYCHYDQYDNGVDVLIEHSPSCWQHDLFKQTIIQCTNTEVFYRAVTFYLREHPLLLNDLLIEISSKLDHTRVVRLLRQEEALPLCLKYLLFVQKDNIVAVNEAVNQLFVDSEDYKALRESIEGHDAFDQITLAQKLETHSLLEMRRISSYLYKVNKRYEVAIGIAKKDVLYEDVISTAAVSKDTVIAEELVRFFVEKKEIACFSAMLYSCYSQIRADVVLELAWRHNIVDNVMPFMIQTFREYDDKLNDIAGKLEAQSKAEKEAVNEEKKKQEQESSKAAQFIGIPSFAGPAAPLAIMPPMAYGSNGSPMMYPGHGGPVMNGQMPGGYGAMPPPNQFAQPHY